MDLSRADIPYEPVDRRPPARLPADDRGQHRSRSARPPRRSRTRAGRCSTSAAASSTPTRRRSCASSRRRDRFPVTCTLMGLGAFPAPHEQWLGMLGMHGTRAANYAMDEADLIFAIGARFDDRITGKLSRVRAAGEVHPHRRRPGRDLQERPGAHPDRRRREERARAADRSSTARSRPTRRGWRSGGRGSTAGASSTRSRYEDTRRHRDQAPAHDPGGLRGDRRRRDRHVRRRPAPDVDGAVLRLPRAAPLDQLRRPRHDGLRPAGGDGREGRLPGRDRRLHRRRRLGADEHAGAGDVCPGGHRRSRSSS